MKKEMKRQLQNQMKKQKGTIMKMILVMTMLFSLTMSNVFAATNQVTVTGNIQTTVIDVDIPTYASFVIDPNFPEGIPGRYMMPSLHVVNNTTAPVTLTLTKFDNKAGTSNQFTEVGYAEKDWSKLGATDSAKYIFLAITAPINQAGFLNHTSLLSSATAVEAQSSARPLCNIRAQSSIDLGMNCKSGSAFTSPITSVYELTFIASLMVDPPTALGTITNLTIDDTAPFTWDGQPSVMFRSLGFPATATVRVTTATPDTIFTINGTEYTGSQVITVNTEVWLEGPARTITVGSKYNGENGIVRFVFN